MNGIKMSDCRFYVNEEERTVVCVIPRTRDLVLDFIDDHFYWADFDFRDAIGLHLLEKLEMPCSFMGKAVCSEGDEWNEETGRLIAYSRARDKCYKSFFKRASLFVQTVDTRLNDMLKLFNDFGEKLDKKKDAINANIEHMLDK